MELRYCSWCAPTASFRPRGPSSLLLNFFFHLEFLLLWKHRQRYKQFQIKTCTPKFHNLICAARDEYAEAIYIYTERYTEAIGSRGSVAVRSNGRSAWGLQLHFCLEEERPSYSCLTRLKNCVLTFQGCPRPHLGAHATLGSASLSWRHFFRCERSVDILEVWLTGKDRLETSFCRRSVIFSQNTPLSQSPNLPSFPAVAVALANYKWLVNEIVPIPKRISPTNESLPVCQVVLLTPLSEQSPVTPDD